MVYRSSELFKFQHIRYGQISVFKVLEKRVKNKTRNVIMLKGRILGQKIRDAFKTWTVDWDTAYCLPVHTAICPD